MKVKMVGNLNITVMMGGPSAERAVSLRSGAAVAAALRSLGHTVQELDPRNRRWRLPARTDVVFLAFHGTYGEDGAVQRRIEKLGIPYTGSDAEASRVAFDKVLTKRRFLEAGVPTPRFAVLKSAAAPWPDGWKPPVVLKPARQGSSLGVVFVERPEHWKAALAESFRHDSRVIIEEKINGRETTVGILDGQPLPVVEIRPRRGHFDYANKYTPGASELLCPAELSRSVTVRVQLAALEAFKAVRARDYARVDVMVCPDDCPVVLEVNTLPGMTDLSLFPKAAAAVGIGYAQLCGRMIELALRHRPGRRRRKPARTPH